MSAITYHACDSCGVRMDKGTPFVGVVLRTETVDQGYWSSTEQRNLELCYNCTVMPVREMLAKFHPTKLGPENESDGGT